MKLAIFCTVIFALCIYFLCPSRDYVTTIRFKQTFSSGYSDSSVAVINTVDSAKFKICYHSPEKYFPTGSFYIANDEADAPTSRHYILPQVIKVEPYFVSSYHR